MPRWIKYILSVVLVLLLLVLLSFQVVPWQVKKQAQRWISSHTERTLSIAEVRFNPFKLSLSVTGLNLTEPNSEQTFVAFDQFDISLSAHSIVDLALIIDQFELDQPYLRLEMRPDSQWNFSDFLVAPAKSEPLEGATKEPGNFRFALNNIVIRSGSVDFSDLASEKTSHHQLRELNLSLPFIGNAPHLRYHYVEPQLSLMLNGARLTSTGHSRPFHDSLETRLALDVSDVDLTYYVENSPLELPLDLRSGLLNAQLELNYQLNKEQAAQFSLRGELGLNKLDLAVPGSDDHLRLQQLALQQLQIDLTGQLVQLQQLRLSDGDIALSRLQNGEFALARALSGTTAQSGSETENGQQSDQSKSGWKLKIEALDLDHFDLSLHDFSLKDQPQLNFSKTELHAQQLSYPNDSPIPFTLQTETGDQGRVALNGSLQLTPLQLNASSQIADLDLTAYNPFLPTSIKPRLKSGRLQADLNVSLQQQQTLSGDFDGSLTISDFNLRDPQGTAGLLLWDGLNLTGIKGNIAPFSLQIKDVALRGYQANIEIAENGRVNLSGLTDTAEKEAGQADTGKTETVEHPAIKIDNLTLQGGTVAFVDRSMERLFSATMYQLGGRVSGLSSDPQTKADVDLRGQLENHAPLTISGQLNPLGDELYADLDIAFKDIDLTPLTPYSGTWLGYSIARGKLYLDLGYHIEKREVDAKNSLMFDQFTLGDKIASDKATSLPVGLAIALLTDVNGEIHLDIPVKGSFDDPQFSITGVVFTILKNLIVKAATAPFKLLAAVLGGGGDEDFSSVVFAPGQATIDQAQQDKLATLAGMLKQRPALNLELSGFIDPEQDPEGYRQEQLQQQLLAAQKSLTGATTEPAKGKSDEQQIGPEAYPELLLAVYQNGDFPKPQTAGGKLVELPLEEMEKLILAHLPAAEQEMAELANARIRAVREALIKADEAIQPRIFIAPRDLLQPPEEGPASRVEFGISLP